MTSITKASKSDHERISHLIRTRVKKAVANGTLHPAHALPVSLTTYQMMGVGAPASLKFDVTGPGVLGVIANAGGAVADPGGRVIEILHNMIGYSTTDAIRMVVNRLVDQGLLHKTLHAGGRATDRVAVTAEGWAFLGGQAPGPVPVGYFLPDFEPGGKHNPHAAPPPPAPAPLGIGHVLAERPATDDLVALQRLCVRLGDERDALQAQVDNLVQRLIVADEEIQRLKARTPQAAPAYAIDANGNGRTLRDRISPDEQAALERLMREVPTTH